MATFSYYLDKPFKKGVNHLEVKKIIKANGSYSKFLNPLDNAIYAWLTLEGGIYMKVRTTERIAPKDWHFVLKKAKPTMAGGAILNERLDDLKSEVLKQYRYLITVNPNPTPTEIKKVLIDAVNGKTPNFNRKTFLERYDEYLNDVKTQLKRLSYNKLKSFKIVFEEYLEHTEKNPRHFFLESIDDEFNISFRNYLLEERGIVNNTASKYYEILKTFLRFWKRKGVFKQVNGDFENYSIKRDHADIIYLTQFEVNKILALDLSETPSLDKARDCFVFQIFTGQRYSDLRGLRSSDLMLNLDGSIDWHLHQVKGNKTKKVIIPLLPEALNVVQKYGLVEKSGFIKKLPVTSNQKLNEKIKVVCKRAEINQTITIVRYSGKKRIELSGEKWRYIGTHCGRKSFISLSLEKNMPMHLIMELSGHSNMRVIKNSYAGLSLSHLRSSLFSAWAIDKPTDDEKTRKLQHS
ncbi:MAG TPA: tyrosine-type recombinase/integrase [Cyclobacteriaceae bacterium]|nr:site-specific integrase [Cyclobacteriaceae bacterium]HMV08066.1 tyrosine-type recombinase/integrase [Cyclobacteriaceae bacterium]HMV88282.1 tyrosine-type recombinase/integrase [Cyclobacteriaceae bacterium]HMX00706.1 tyrosine-type recombinase/integrase [Cyclobacteriaceae bacterium]HMX49419.1 tyrosine-type recombinase/integrase [Cyclobacteriaceae bacterium]